MQPLPSSLPPKEKKPLVPVLITAALVGIAGGGIYWLRNRQAPPPPPAPVAEAPPVAPAVPTPPKDPLQEAGLRRVSLTIDGPLETCFVQQLGSPLGPQLTQVVTRSLVWWVDVPGDFRKGDTLDVLFAERPGEEPLVHAVRYHSGKHAKDFRAYRFAAPGSKFARFFDETGHELELRLDGGPIEDYEQVTSLLKDGRRHKGVDFKAPVGTDVRAPFNGTITRKNWNFRGNGNCLELTERGGRRKALFLHLSELPKSLRVGQAVQAGEVLAQSGNSGRSFAPHLHYQLMSSGDRVLDPFDEHKTARRALETPHQAAFAAELKRYDALWAQPLAHN